MYWYERNYHRHDDKENFDFLSSLAQIIYEEIGYFMPRDMYECCKHLRELGWYGIRCNQANPYLNLGTSGWESEGDKPEGFDGDVL